MACEYGSDEAGTLQFLVDVCDDAADGAFHLADLFDKDGALDTAEVFRRVAEQREQFAARLRQLMEELPPEALVPPERTDPRKVFHWRLQIARHLPVGHRNRDDHRGLLEIARRGSNAVLDAYAVAEDRLAGCPSVAEVHREAEAVRASSSLIFGLAA
jgi:hypothetical protein